MATNPHRGIHLGFYSKALDGDAHPLSLLGLEGDEELSRPFSFDLLLYRGGPPLERAELAALVTEPCVIAFGVRRSDVVHGVLSHVEHVDGGGSAGAYYRARLVPYVSLLGIGKRSAIHQDTTVPEMVARILSSYGLSADTDFRILVGDDRKSPTHEYIVQYQESDWDFIQRWLEHEGYFYWFTHGDGVGLVIADTNEDATPIAAPSTLPHRGRNNLADDGRGSVWAVHARQERVPASVTLVDYNHRRPLDVLIATHKIATGTFGHVFQYGDHFKDLGVGAAWAKIRAEELSAAQHVVSGSTDCARLRVGHSFTIEDSTHAPYDGKYLVTAIRHSAGRSPRDGGSRDANPYEGRFSAIPFDVPFRPRRTTPWPSIEGVIHGHVDADSSGDYAQIDDQGRYKVKLPFDVGASSGLASSRWMRMAQPHAGSGYGSHHPLHKGTEVIVAHIDGDPDRPVILGAVPNAITPGPVVDANATQSVIQTASGIRVVFEDLQK